ncbi:MAG: hypothetical protein A2252_01345 [Elusimicrobia bacterium RIFOXYA2_FULL_39_19]|nr:MAG: hypothetical protein A2252_01345 [Elusimicrobia bacterium RIFOXYA2_FULL_39_19]
MKKILIFSIFAMTTIFFPVLQICAQEQYEKVSILINEEKYEEAMSLLNALPDTTDKKILQAVIYLQTSKYAEAETVLNEALKENADSLMVRYSLAMLYEKQKRPEDAIDQWEKVISLSNNNKLKTLAQKHIRQLKK